MPLHPQLAELATRNASRPEPVAVASPEVESVVDLRARANRQVDKAFAMFVAAGSDRISIADHAVPVSGASITVRAYRPPLKHRLPVYLYLHGGGWWMCTIDQYDHIGREVAESVQCCVLAVDYRLAPEHPYPTPLDDCVAALRWAVDNADRLAIDPDRMAVGGDSAGGNLAAALCLRWRDEGARPPLRAQVLEVPVTDATQSFPSITENARYLPEGPAALARSRRYYCPDADLLKHGYVSPVWAADLAGLPPALVLTAEFDPLRDEGEAYARRLAESGTPTTLWRGLGYTHGSMMFTKLIPEASLVRAEITRFLQSRLS